MPKKRISMSKIREALRLKFDCGLSNRNIAACLKLGPSSVSELLSRFKQSPFTWPLSDDISDQQLTSVLYRPKGAESHRVMPDFAACFLDLKRKGMTKMLLWQEYYEQYREQAYAYTQFCEYYNRWLKKQKRSMRQTHLAGDKLFIDYCGRPFLWSIRIPVRSVRHKCSSQHWALPDRGHLRKRKKSYAKTQRADVAVGISPRLLWSYCARGNRRSG